MDVVYVVASTFGRLRVHPVGAIACFQVKRRVSDDAANELGRGQVMVDSPGRYHGSLPAGSGRSFDKLRARRLTAPDGVPQRFAGFGGGRNLLVGRCNGEEAKEGDENRQQAVGHGFGSTPESTNDCIPVFMFQRWCFRGAVQALFTPGFHGVQAGRHAASCLFGPYAETIPGFRDQARYRPSAEFT